MEILKDGVKVHVIPSEFGAICRRRNHTQGSLIGIRFSSCSCSLLLAPALLSYFARPTNSRGQTCPAIIRALGFLILAVLCSCSTAREENQHEASVICSAPATSFFVDGLSRQAMETYTSSNPQNSSDQLDRVCIIGSGNWGSAIAKIIGENCQRLDHFHTQVHMWVHEETVTLSDGTQELLTNVINTQHENIKYLPGIKLPKNVRAVADLAEACQGATLLIFVLPHQFLPRLLPIIRASAHRDCRGVSLIKGLGTLIFSKVHYVLTSGKME
jgi:hypothetical protein